MLHHRRTHVALWALSGVIALLAVACTGQTSDSTPAPAPGDAAGAGAGAAAVGPTASSSTPEAAAGPAAESKPTGGPQVDPPTDTGPDVSGSTQTPTPTLAAAPEETPVSETESVNFYIRGFNSIGRGEFVDAERTFTTVIELEPGFARGWDGRGQALMLQGKLEEAMLDFDRAIELKPNLAEAYANRALTRVALDDLGGASRDAKRAVELDDRSVAAQIVLGRVYARKGDATRALEWFDLAVSTDSEDGSTWWWRGRFYRDVLGEGNQALSDFNRAIELAPAQAALYIDRALLYIQANAPTDLARADLEEAISLSQDPRLPTIIERAENLLKVIDERDARDAQAG